MKLPSRKQYSNDVDSITDRIYSNYNPTSLDDLTENIFQKEFPYIYEMMHSEVKFWKYKERFKLLGIQNVYTPFEKIFTKDTFDLIKFLSKHSYFESYLFMYNWEIFIYLFKNGLLNYFKNMRLFYAVDSKEDEVICKLISKICKIDIKIIKIYDFKDKKTSYEDNIKEAIKKCMEECEVKHFDLVLSNPPYSTKLNVDIDIKILNFIMTATNNLIFIMPSMTYIMKYFDKDSLKDVKKVFYKNEDKFLEKFILIDKNVFNGNCGTDQNLCIVYFSKNKDDKKIEYIDSINNLKRTLKSIDELTHYLDMDNDEINLLNEMKLKIDNWLKNHDTFQNHFIGSCLQVSEKIDKNKLNNINIDNIFWMAGANGGGTTYKDENGNVNKNFGIINSGSDEHFNNNLFFIKNKETLKELGKNRMVFVGNSINENELNWKFACFSPIMKLIFFYYRSARCWGWNIVPWFDKKLTFNDLCNEIGYNEDHIKLIKKLFKDIQPISWE